MEKSINAIRFLGLDMVDEAASGHPGIVLGAAPIMYQLFTKHLKHNPQSSKWFDRDRFILSAGHGSALLYATLHFSGYDVSMDDLKQFRQIGSITPGHPEYGDTDGVEATTGPLGQGISNAVGMALAEKHLRNTYNKKSLKVVDHYTYTLVGDGDLQEGVALESMSLAGHLNLERLIVLFDSNDIQLDGPTSDAYSDDMKQKVLSMNWDYQRVEDANDLDALDEAIENAKKSDRPSFIEVKSIIGYGSDVAGTSKAHGAPIGKEATQALKEKWNFNHEPFDIPASVYEDFTSKIQPRSEDLENDWRATMDEYSELFPKEFETLSDMIEQTLHVDFDKLLKHPDIGHSEATRGAVGNALAILSDALPQMIGGSADLSGSTKVKGNDGNFTKENPKGRNINFGVREHAMAAITNGLALHNLKAFAGGFFIFSDYMKPAIRLAALSHIPSVFIFTHDSVAVGEDGPTHEPIEQLAVFRSTPNLITMRPAHSGEVHHALRFAFSQTKKPSALVLTRQNVDVKHVVSYDEFIKGAYAVNDIKDPDGIIIATGSEVSLAIDAAQALEDEGKKVRVISMPSMELFEMQSDKYKEKILPSNLKDKTLALELGSPQLWYQYAKDVIGMTTFGKSGKGDEVVHSFGFTKENVVKRFLSL